MEKLYLKNDWEFFNDYFEIIDLYHAWKRKGEDREDKAIKKREVIDKETPRNFADEIVKHKEQLAQKYSLSKSNGVSFFMDRITKDAGLDENESLILIFLIHHRTLGNLGSMILASELMKTLFPKRQELLEGLYCLSPEGKLRRFGLIQMTEDNVKVSEKIYKKFLKIGQTPRIIKKIEGWQDKALTYPDYLEVSYLLSDLMWERAEVISVLGKTSNHQMALKDLEEINTRISVTKNALEEMTASSIAKDFPLVAFCNKYHLGFEERMVVVTLMQTSLEFRKDTLPKDTYIKVLELSRFLSAGTDEIVRNLRFFNDKSPLINEQILEDFWGWRQELMQNKRFSLSAGVSDFFIGNEQGSLQDKFEELSEKLKNKSQVTSVLSARFTLDDVVMELANRDRLLASLAQYQNRDLIFNQWGFGDVIKYGTSVTMLFAGPPGTGKTMAAEAIAGHLGKKIMIIDYSRLESKWVGETEQNIVKAFKTASEKDAVLVFDEADAVFYDRSSAVRSWEVREVNVLLQEMEKFKGILVLTTNRHDSFDPALERRISLRLLFNPPKPNERLLLWKKHFPSKAPLAEDINFNTLAFEYDLTGAQIKNIALCAARKASLRFADAVGTVITHQDIKSAITDEKTLCWSGGTKGAMGFLP